LLAEVKQNASNVPDWTFYGRAFSSIIKLKGKTCNWLKALIILLNLVKFAYLIMKIYKNEKKRKEKVTSRLDVHLSVSVATVATHSCVDCVHHWPQNYVRVFYL